MIRTLLAAALVFSAQPAFSAVTACIYEAAGPVQIKRSTGPWKEAAKGDAVSETDQLRTGAGGRCELLFKEGTFVKLESGSEMTVEDLRAAADERVFSFSLLRGKVLWMAAKVKNKMKSGFRVRTPAAVCAVRGTDFSTIVSTSGATELGLFEGEVAVTGASEEKVLQAGGEITAEAGGAELRAQDKFTPVMRAEERRYLKLKDRVEKLRQRLAERDDFIDDYMKKQEKKLSDFESRRQEKLKRR